MHLHRRAALCLLAFALALPAIAATSVAWVLDYTGKSTNRFIWDKRTRALVTAHVPAPLARDVLDGLGGPPEPVFVTAGRYLSASACVAHACPDKGFFWIDSVTGIALGAYGSGSELRIGSKDFGAAALPAPARQALLAWLTDNRIAPRSVTFTGRDGRAAALDAAPFTPPARYLPPAGGPSFDCARAATAVEKTICATPALARKDLELATLLEQMRHGYDTIDDRAQLLALQRAWLKKRDAACASAGDAAACLAAQYDAQHERLMNWVPTR